MPRRSVLAAHQEIFRKICIASEKFTSVWRNSVFYTLKAVITPIFLQTPGPGGGRVGAPPEAGAVLLEDSRILTCPRGWDWISQLWAHLVRDPIPHLHLHWLLHPLSWAAGELRYWVRGLRVVRQTFVFVRLQPFTLNSWRAINPHRPCGFLLVAIDEDIFDI